MPTRAVKGAFLSAAPMIFAAMVIATLAYAWTLRNDGILHADHGAGYWLGIAGTAIMLVLFLYPLRKRFPSLAVVGSVAMWFRLHMILGVLGPTMVILHSNFNLGPLNSMLALLSMLVVVTSGIVGRYLHARVHNGLYGQHAQLRDLVAGIADMQHQLQSHFPQSGAISQYLTNLLPPVPNAAATAGELKAAGVTRRNVRGARSRIRAHLKRAQWTDPGSGQPLTAHQRALAIRQVDDKLRSLGAAVAKAERLRFYERLLSIWHHLHTPLFVLLFLTVILHIIAAELY